VFADVAPNREAILEFVNTYGVLGISDPVPVRGPYSESMKARIASVPKPLLTMPAAGEPLAVWQREIQTLSRAVRRLTGAERLPPVPRTEVDVDEIGSFSWRRGKNSDQQFFEMREAYYVDGIADARPRDIVGQWIQREVNRRLSHGMMALLRRPDGSETFTLEWGPKNLLTNLWLQLALSMTTGRKFKKCAACPNWFVATRVGKKTCSGRCRVRLSRSKPRQ
jgi:hypothetical protein